MSTVKVTFVDEVGAEHLVDAAIGGTLMEAGRDAGVPGILADCGGACACATCFVIVPAASLKLVGGGAEGAEADMLEFTDYEGEGGRLSCQIQVTEGLQGLRVSVPAS